MHVLSGAGWPYYITGNTCQIPTFTGSILLLYIICIYKQPTKIPPLRARTCSYINWLTEASALACESLCELIDCVTRHHQAPVVRGWWRRMWPPSAWPMENSRLQTAHSCTRTLSLSAAAAAAAGSALIDYGQVIFQPPSPPPHPPKPVGDPIGLTTITITE